MLFYNHKIKVIFSLLFNYLTNFSKFFYRILINYLKLLYIYIVNLNKFFYGIFKLFFSNIIKFTKLLFTIFINNFKLITPLRIIVLFSISILLKISLLPIKAILDLILKTWEITYVTSNSIVIFIIVSLIFISILRKYIKNKNIESCLSYVISTIINLTILYWIWFMVTKSLTTINMDISEDICKLLTISFTNYYICNMDNIESVNLREFWGINHSVFGDLGKSYKNPQFPPEPEGPQIGPSQTDDDSSSNKNKNKSEKPIILKQDEVEDSSSSTYINSAVKAIFGDLYKHFDPKNAYKYNNSYKAVRIDYSLGPNGVSDQVDNLKCYKPVATYYDAKNHNIYKWFEVNKYNRTTDNLIFVKNVTSENWHAVIPVKGIFCNWASEPFETCKITAEVSPILSQIYEQKVVKFICKDPVVAPSSGNSSSIVSQNNPSLLDLSTNLTEGVNQASLSSLAINIGSSSTGSNTAFSLFSGSDPEEWQNPKKFYYTLLKKVDSTINLENRIESYNELREQVIAYKTKYTNTLSPNINNLHNPDSLYIFNIFKNIYFSEHNIDIPENSFILNDYNLTLMYHTIITNLDFSFPGLKTEFGEEELRLIHNKLVRSLDFFSYPKSIIDLYDDYFIYANFFDYIFHIYKIKGMIFCKEYYENHFNSIDNLKLDENLLFFTRMTIDNLINHTI